MRRPARLRGLSRFVHGAILMSSAASASNAAECLTSAPGEFLVSVKESNHSSAYFEYVCSKSALKVVGAVLKMSLPHPIPLVNFIALTGRKSESYERGSCAMDTAEPKLLHLPFFETLARTQEGSAEWRLTSAGLVTLRLFDAWVVEGPSVVAADSWGLRAVRESIEGLRSGSNVKAILGSVVDAMEASDSVRVPVVAPRLLAYGRALQFEGAFTLAADVHSTVLAHAHPIDESDMVIAASLQLGVCLRAMADWDEAGAAFARASVVASM